MFDIGFTELLVIAVVALLVLGPERLPQAARFAGLWVRRGRAQWASVRSELASELAADELNRSLPAPEDAMPTSGEGPVGKAGVGSCSFPSFPNAQHKTFSKKMIN